MRAILWYRFLYFKFKPHRYYWGCVHLLRSGLISLTPLITNKPHLQIVLLQFFLVTFLALQCSFWPYRTEIHNYADVASQGMMITLSTAAAFFLPSPSGDHQIVVDAVTATFCVGGMVFLGIIAIPFRETLRTLLMSKERRELRKLKQLENERSFNALLQQTEEDELFGVEEFTVDVAKIVGVLPKLDARSLVCAPTDRVEGGKITVPSQHPAMREACKGIVVYEKKLRSRAQESFDSPGSPVQVEWSAMEKEELRQLVAYVSLFVWSYASALLMDPDAVQVLKAYAALMEQKFNGVYRACTRDILQHEPGFYKAIFLAHALKQTVECAGGVAVRSLTDPIEVFTVAVIAQEYLCSYTAELAQATDGATSKSAVKHLFRILEKQGFDQGRALGGPAPAPWDAARALVCYGGMSALVLGLERLQNDHREGRITVLRAKERFSSPTSAGWSDILVNLCLPQVDFPCEIQMVHSKMMLIRHDMGAHGEYAKFRTAKEVLDLQMAFDGGSSDENPSTLEMQEEAALENSVSTL